MKTNNKQLKTKWYSAKYDRVFKSVVVDEKDHSIMEAILSSILEEQVEIIAYRLTEMKVNSTLEKVRVADVLIELHGEFIHIEVETGTGLEATLKNFTTFTTFYNQSICRGESYDTVTKFVHITLQFGLGDARPLKETYYIMDKNTNTKLIDNIEILRINMDKLKRMWDNKITEALHYKYLVMLNLEKEELEAFDTGDDIVAKFKKKINKLNDSPRFQAMMDYETRERILQNTAKDLAYEKGKSEGISQGEKQKQIEIAKEMKNDDLSNDIIKQYTKLSIEEIQNIKP